MSFAIARCSFRVYRTLRSTPAAQRARALEIPKQSCIASGLGPNALNAFTAWLFILAASTPLLLHAQLLNFGHVAASNPWTGQRRRVREAGPGCNGVDILLVDIFTLMCVSVSVCLFVCLSAFPSLRISVCLDEWKSSGEVAESIPQAMPSAYMQSCEASRLHCERCD